MSEINYHIYEAIDSIFKITCTKCGTIEILQFIDETLEAADAFERAGWRGTKKNIYCPNCNSKKTK